jgi:large subunit ribosomal protein L25
MAKAIGLKAVGRSAKGRGPVGRLRRSGRVPAVLYGKRIETVALELGERELNVAIHGSSSENVLLELSLDVGGKNSTTTAFVQHVQHDPLSGRILHVDLHEIAADEKLKAHVPVKPSGEAIGVKTFGGILEHILRDLHVECLPKDLPDSITVDVSHLNVGQSIHVREIAAPAGVLFLNSSDVVVFAVAAPKVEEEAVPAVAEAAATAEAGAAAPEGKGAEGKGADGKAPEGKGPAVKGSEGKGAEGKGRG